MDDLHFGRHFVGNFIERMCPCELAPCGLATSASFNTQCDQHGWAAAKTMRQMHKSVDCPGKPIEEVVV